MPAPRASEIIRNVAVVWKPCILGGKSSCDRCAPPRALDMAWRIPLSVSPRIAAKLNGLKEVNELKELKELSQHYSNRKAEMEI